MFQCKACGGSLRFDVESQMLHCDYCGQSYDPGTPDIEAEANESYDEEFDVTYFTCPSCGARMGGVETSAAEFCSYCGNSGILKSRLGKMKSPRYIIPFKITKKDCGQALDKKLKSAFFVPKDFKDSQADMFRGIYMPYWSYKVSQQGFVNLHAQKYSHSEGDYEYFDNYRIHSKVDAEYDGIPHDASKAFADRISEALEPYDHKGKQEFKPGYMAGFYADIQDVKSEIYEQDVRDFANQRTFRTMLSQVEFADEEITECAEKDKLDNILHTQVKSVDCTMLPVWFMSYRKNDRVAYAAVNGETGKVVSDMPLDLKKIWAVIPLLAIPLFFILNLFLSVQAKTTLIFSVAALGAASLVYWLELFMLADHEKYINMNRASKKRSARMKKKPKVKAKTGKKGGHVLARAVGSFFTAIACLLLGYFFLATVLEFAGIALIALLLIPFLAAIIMPIVGIVMCFMHKLTDGSGREVLNLLGFFLLIGMTILDVLIYFLAPVSDIYYYAGVILSLTAILFTISRVISVYNIFTTRPLPQFGERGGE